MMTDLQGIIEISLKHVSKASVNIPGGYLK